MLPSILNTRRLELERRSNLLLSEVDDWISRSLNQIGYNSHFSQMQAIKVMMTFFTSRQQKILTDLNSTADISKAESLIFELIQEIIKSQRIWDFFRDKLEQRFSPNFKQPLAVADTVAWDCYWYILNNAHKFDIISPDHFREPPLTYLSAEFSPLTWVRGSRPNDGRDYLGGKVTIPIPVIEIPWDHVVNLWEFLSLHHEVGHDIEADLGLRPVLFNSLSTHLIDARVPNDRVTLWLRWKEEIFADLVALLLAGPAFARYMISLLLLAPAAVTTYNSNDPHPSHYIRIFLNTEFVRTLGNQMFHNEAQKLDILWNKLYGTVAQLDIHKVQDLRDDFKIVFKALIDTKFDLLKGHSVRELIPYTSKEDATIRDAADFLATGKNKPHSIWPRHIISASRLSLDKIMEQQGNHSVELKDLNKRTEYLVNANTPPGVRGASFSKEHRQFIISLTEAL